MRDLPGILTPLVETVAKVLEDAGRPVGLAHLVPGVLPAWDNCCEGAGQAYLRVIEVYPTAGSGQPPTPFPQRDTMQRGVGAGGGCSINLLALHLGLGVIRCAHSVDDHGNPPTAAEMTSDAAGMLDDMGLLLEVITQVFTAHKALPKVIVGSWTPRGPEGGCVGGEWTLYAALDPCLGVIEEPSP